MKIKKILGLALVGLGLVGSTSALSSCDGEKTDPNAEMVLTALDALTVSSEVSGNFTLTTQGAGGVVISWSSSDTNVISIEGGNATVTQPAIGQADATVTLTATAVYEDYQEVKNFTVTVKALTLNDQSKKVSAIKELADETEVDARGVVTGFVYASGNSDPEYKAGFYLTDETGTIYVYGTNVAQSVNLNSEIYFTATKTTHKEGIQLSTPKDVIVIQQETTPKWDAVITDKTAVDIYNATDNIVGNVYEFDALIYKNSYGAYSVEDPNYAQSGAALGDYFSGSSSNDLTQYAAILRGKENTIVRVRFVINSKTTAGKWRGTTLTVEELSTAELAKWKMSSLVSLQEEYQADTSVNLPAEIEGLTGVSVAWSLKEGSLGAEISEGKLNITATDDLQKFTLVATATVSGADPIVYEFAEVSVQKSAISDGENQTITLQYEGTATTNMTGGNDAALLGLNPVLFTVVSDAGSKVSNGNPLHIGLNKAGSIRLYGVAGGDGNALSITINDVDGKNVVINSITITFGSTVGNFTVNGTEGSKDTATYDVNGKTVTIKDTTDATTQVHISSIVINYSITVA